MALSYGEVLVYPFTVPRESRRRRVVGLDVWLDARPGQQPDLGPGLVAALRPTPARLTYLADLEGRRAWPSEPEAGCAPRLCGRILIRDEDTHLTDDALAEILGAVGSVASWTLALKLEEFDAVPAYPPLRD